MLVFYIYNYIVTFKDMLVFYIYNYIVTFKDMLVFYICPSKWNDPLLKICNKF